MLTRRACARGIAPRVTVALFASARGVFEANKEHMAKEAGRAWEQLPKEHPLRRKMEMERDKANVDRLSQEDMSNWTMHVVFLIVCCVCMGLELIDSDENPLPCFTSAEYTEAPPPGAKTTVGADGVTRVDKEG